jgi:hypothetical protein
MRMRFMAMISLLALVILLASKGGAANAQAADPGAVTFTETIAPILYDHCIMCHRSGEIAPFPLISYEDAVQRGRKIAEVTASRAMPPWKPAHDFGEFVGERRLSDDEIESIRRWVEQGMPEGDPARLPALPRFTQGWQLGQPDLVLEMPATFELPADGPDVYRNFVLPTGLTEDKWVRAVELRPSARAAAHHALFAYVEHGSFAAQNRADGEPGFGGSMAVGFVPGRGNSGSLGGWAVGGRPMVFPDGGAVALPANTDFLLQMHFHLTGKAERERALVGLYFSEEPPSKAMASLELPALFGFGAGIDIPAGESDYVVRDAFTLPADVTVYSAWGHAHYLGRELKVEATLPDGSTTPLLLIPDWDFHWQEIYQFKKPVPLPKGTRVEGVIRYDNSRGNPSNPHYPPQRVRWGLESTDEMGTIGLLLEIMNRDDEAAFRRALADRTRAAIQHGVEDGTVQRFLAEQAKLDAGERDGRPSGSGGAPAHAEAGGHQ